MILIIPPRNEFSLTNKGGAVFIWIKKIQSHLKNKDHIFDSKIFNLSLNNLIRPSILNKILLLEILLFTFFKPTKLIIVHNDVLVFQLIYLFKKNVVFHAHNEYQSSFTKLFFRSKYKRLFCCSNFLESKFSNYFFSTNVLKNGVHKQSNLKKIKSRKFSLAFIGRNDLNKNFEGFLETLEKLKHDEKLYIVVIGFGFESLTFDNKEKIKSLSAKYNFTFKGIIPHDDVISILKNSKILWHMPKFNEAFGMVVLEAFSCGCNVVARDFKGISEILINLNYSGLKKLDYDLAAKKITHFLKLDTTFFSQNIEKYTWQSIASDYENLKYDITK